MSVSISDYRHNHYNYGIMQIIIRHYIYYSMDDYDSPFGRRRATSPVPKSSFQRELEAKMRDRQRKGLAADVTPNDSAHGSEDELGSDDGKYSIVCIMSYGIELRIKVF